MPRDGQARGSMPERSREWCQIWRSLIPDMPEQRSVGYAAPFPVRPPPHGTVRPTRFYVEGKSEPENRPAAQTVTSPPPTGSPSTAKTPSSPPDPSTTQYYRGDKSWRTLVSTAVPEGTNLYYGDARSLLAFSATAPITYTNTTGAFSMATAASGVNVAPSVSLTAHVCCVNVQ